ncbi:MAG: hypothetical protein KatS3mg060_1946 [Dehalococcoidia bacterium]|nr:MAG: hypothetical protein KatS3mg060_1946 [Dehalococcoidia bacterium]
MIPHIRSLPRSRWLVLVVAPLVLLGLLAGGIAFAAGESIPRNVLSGGGGLLTAPGLRLQNVMAQPAAGTVRNQVTLCAGLLCGQGVQPSCTTALASVSISGPGNVAVNEPAAFSAAPSPADATLPIGYSWTPAPSLGQNTSSATYVFSTAGQTVIRVQADNCGGTVSAEATVFVTASSSGETFYSPTVFVDSAGS